MNTIILGAIGIILLVAVAFLFNALEMMKSKKVPKHLADIRKALARKSQWLHSSENENNTSVLRRRHLNSKLDIFPPNGDTPVL